MDLSVLNGYLNKKVEDGVPGCEVMVARDHEILFHAGAGNAKPGTRYFLYSCTKPVTAAAGMIAMEQKLFSLDDPVGQYLPAFFENAAWKTATVRHLFTMTAGFNYRFDTPALRDLPEDATTVAFAEALASAAPDFTPGTRFQYSLCHDVLAAVIEKTSGMTFGAFCQKYIFDPLGMTDTSFYLPGADTTGIAPLYRYDAKARRVVRNEVQYPDHVRSSGHYSGGAGLVSTMADYLKFADALACGGEPILKSASIDCMRTEQLTALNAAADFGCTCGPDYGYGLGVRTRIKTEHGVPGPLGEFGWDGAAGADILIDPENRLSIVYAQHVLNWPDMGDIPHLVIRDILYRAL